MQTQHQSKGSDLDSLEELLANFNLMQAAKPLGCSQFELALAAVLNASKVVGGTLPQSARVRASSLPVGIPSYAPSTPSTAAGSPVQAVPLYRSRVNGSLTPPNLKLASPQSDRPPIKTCLYKVYIVHLIAPSHLCCMSKISCCMSKISQLCTCISLATFCETVIHAALG